MEKKEEDDSNEEKKENAYEVEQKQKLKFIYSKPELIKKAKKEISLIRKKIKAKKKS